MNPLGIICVVPKGAESEVKPLSVKAPGMIFLSAVFVVKTHERHYRNNNDRVRC